MAVRRERPESFGGFPPRLCKFDPGDWPDASEYGEGRGWVCAEFWRQRVAHEAAHRVRLPLAVVGFPVDDVWDWSGDD